jgi:hypothetical protein
VNDLQILVLVPGVGCRVLSVYWVGHIPGHTAAGTYSGGLRGVAVGHAQVS